MQAALEGGVVADILFNVGSLLAAIGWLGLLLALFSVTARPYLVKAARFAIPILLAAAYIVLLATGSDAFRDGGFSSIAQVRALFAHDNALTAGWLHYLAFDLFVGAWIAERGAAQGISVLLLVPCLILTFLLGPVGFLLFVLFSAMTPKRA